MIDRVKCRIGVMERVAKSGKGLHLCNQLSDNLIISSLMAVSVFHCRWCRQRHPDRSAQHWHSVELDSAQWPELKKKNRILIIYEYMSTSLHPIAK